MTRTIQEIKNSLDLAAVLNAPPLTEEDSRETPLDWAGISLFGSDGPADYEIDRKESTATRCVLANGTAAVDYLSAREWHACPIAKSAPEALKAHWCPAKYESTTWEESDAVVTRDWRQVHVGQASYSDAKVYPTLKAAREAYESEVAQMEQAVNGGPEPMDAPEVTVSDVRALLGSVADDPVMNIAQVGGRLRVEVNADGLVGAVSVITTRAAVWEMTAVNGLGDVDAEDIRALLPGLQQRAGEIAALWLTFPEGDDEDGDDDF